MDFLPPLSVAAQSFKPGNYRHCKGGMYQALAVARHSEDSNEEFVVYRHLNDGSMFVRPLGIFLESVEVDGRTRPRFERVGE